MANRRKSGKRGQGWEIGKGSGFGFGAPTMNDPIGGYAKPTASSGNGEERGEMESMGEMG